MNSLRKGSARLRTVWQFDGPYHQLPTVLARHPARVAQDLYKLCRTEGGTRRLSPAVLLVIICAHSYAGRDGQMFASQETIARDCGVSLATVGRVFSVLQKVEFDGCPLLVLRRRKQAPAIQDWRGFHRFIVALANELDLPALLVPSGNKTSQQGDESCPSPRPSSIVTDLDAPRLVNEDIKTRHSEHQDSSLSTPRSVTQDGLRPDFAHDLQVMRERKGKENQELEKKKGEKELSPALPFLFHLFALIQEVNPTAELPDPEAYIAQAEEIANRGINLEHAMSVATWAFRESETWKNGYAWRLAITTPAKFWQKWEELDKQYGCRLNRRPQRGEPVHRVTGIKLTARKGRRGDEPG
jgi:hypothetical protein